MQSLAIHVCSYHDSGIFSWSHDNTLFPEIRNPELFVQKILRRKDHSSVHQPAAALRYKCYG